MGHVTTTRTILVDDTPIGVGPSLVIASVITESATRHASGTKTYTVRATGRAPTGLRTRTVTLTDPDDHATVAGLLVGAERLLATLDRDCGHVSGRGYVCDATPGHRGSHITRGLRWHA